MSFGANADIHMAKIRSNSDSCNINKLKLFNSIADNFYKMHRNISFHSLSPDNMFLVT